jgi:carboxypeptidase C (cathepsin A)
MTGGPGCSSEVALFGENGPCSVNANGTDTIKNPYSWNSKASVLYIDQPAGTGFSYGAGVDHDEKGVARDMYDFLQQFFKAHPKYQTLPFFAFGESYAGHYIPAVTHAIWQNNRALPSGAIRINLVGTSVGNGLTDPEVQYKYYADMAYSSNHHKPVVNKLEYGLMKAATVPCVAMIKACQTNVTACILATDLCNIGLLLPYQDSGRNPYDMRIKCAKKPLCYDFSNVGKYLSRPDVKAALGVDAKRSWSDCNMAVNILFEFSGDWMHDYQQMIPDQLASGIRVMIYAGDQDYICNWLGNRAWVNALPWAHQAEFQAAQPTNWTVAGEAAGTRQYAANFTFLRVYEAGHMVPRDQPARALAMVNAFMDGKL